MVGPSRVVPSLHTTTTIAVLQRKHAFPHSPDAATRHINNKSGLHQATHDTNLELKAGPNKPRDLNGSNTGFKSRTKDQVREAPRQSRSDRDFARSHPELPADDRTSIRTTRGSSGQTTKDDQMYHSPQTPHKWQRSWVPTQTAPTTSILQTSAQTGGDHKRGRIRTSPPPKRASSSPQDVQKCQTRHPEPRRRPRRTKTESRNS